MGYSQGYDTVLFVTGTHRVMYDRLQLVLQHPSTCPHKGSRRDQYKTFHLPQQALEQVERCGEVLTLEQEQSMHEQGVQCQEAVR